jgi:hypothetical protein
VTTAVAGVDDAPPRLSWRVAGLLALIGVPTVLGLAVRHVATRSLVIALFHYSADRFVHGRVWTLVLSGLLPPNPNNVGPTTIVMTAVLVPYVLLRGPWRAVGRFLAGHVVATLAVAALVLPAAAVGSGEAATVARTPDFGVSAGLAAVAGAMVIVLWRRQGPIAGGVLLAGVMGLFAVRFLTTASLGHHLAESEHVIAAAVGLVLERRSR